MRFRLPFQTDRAYLIAFCCLWYALSADLLRALHTSWLGALVLAAVYVNVTIRADINPVSPEFVRRFVRAATEAMLAAAAFDVIASLVVVATWAAQGGPTDIRARLDAATSAGVASADGGVLFAVSAVTWLLVFVLTPRRLRTLGAQD